MALREAASAGVLALLTLVGVILSARLEIGSVTRPGPGFFPLVLTTALGVVAVALLLTARRRRDRDRPRTDKSALTALAPRESGGDPPVEAPHRTHPWKLVATIGAFAVYIALFERLGFVLATVGLLAFLFGALARYRWPIALVAGVLLALAAHLVFDRWLQVPLPPGILGRW
jgi:putative tricarboxylic transport membrane protein